MESKKVVLFIVEGVSDENSLGLIMHRIMKKYNVKFHVVGGDITSEKNTNVSNCISKVTEEIKKFLEEHKYEKSDILKIVHLIDTDGAFIPDNKIIEDDEVKLKYTPDVIITSSVESIVDRNARKSSVASKLSTVGEIYSIPYEMYYFSCNLEHVLHNKENLNSHYKEDYSDRFLDEFIDKEDEFIDFMCKSSFSVKGNYHESWEFIKCGTNSLKRYSNLGILFHT